MYQNGLISGYSKVISGLHADYPPISYAILYVARFFGNELGLPSVMSFKVTIFLFQLTSAAIVLLLSNSYWIAVALNGSLLLSSVGLGDMDIFVAPSLIGALWAFQLDRKVLGSEFFLIACLTKWQPLIVGSFVAMYLLEISDFRTLRNAVVTPLFRHLGVLVIVTAALLSLLSGSTQGVHSRTQ